MQDFLSGQTAPASGNVVEIDAQNFQQEILQGSQQKLVVIEFYASQSQDSLALSPKLEKLLAQFPDTVTLARVNCEEPQMQQLAMQFGVQGLPTVIIFKDGQGVDAFAGDKNEQELDTFFAEYLPKPEDALLADAQQKVAAGQFNEALAPAKQALELAPQRADIKKVVIEVLLNTGNNSEAETLLSEITMVDQDDYYKRLQAQLELNQQAAETPEIKALKADLAANPESPEITLKLAVQLHQAQQNEEALDILFAVLKKDLNAMDGELKKAFMDILATAAQGDPVATRMRRKLYSLLY
ncbi:tetratricopeptide repeat protein [Gayadomonas joobiniege]|uniref:tetratricopeptide repeat protein n=1 Tax=Gayadomonas joobiniege TaxID=1234606 RepID=UPI00037870AD|nr:tetratricopeptide repeat protein [Gayadomonas joobiniege]